MKKYIYIVIGLLIALILVILVGSIFFLKPLIPGINNPTPTPILTTIPTITEQPTQKPRPTPVDEFLYDENFQPTEGAKERDQSRIQFVSEIGKAFTDYFNKTNKFPDAYKITNGKNIIFTSFGQDATVYRISGFEKIEISATTNVCNEKSQTQEHKSDTIWFCMDTEKNQIGVRLETQKLFLVNI